MNQIGILLYGDKSKSKREIETAPSLEARMGLLAWGAWNHRGAPTGTMKNLLQDIKKMTEDALHELKKIQKEIDAMKEKASQQGVPYWD